MFDRLGLVPEGVEIPDIKKSFSSCYGASTDVACELREFVIYILSGLASPIDTLVIASVLVYSLGELSDALASESYEHMLRYFALNSFNRSLILSDCNSTFRCLLIK